MSIRSFTVRACLALAALGLSAPVSHAQITQNPTAFAITIDGKFTNASEWSDVAPMSFSTANGTAFTYTTVSVDKKVLALMYDNPGSTTAFSGLSGPIEFNIGSTPGPTQQHFQVFFTNSGINVWRSVGSGSPVPFNVTCPGFPDQIIGVRFFGPSRNSAVLHNQHELAVRLDCTDPTLVCVPSCPGIYSPAPSHWGASIANGDDPGHCVLPDQLCSDGQPQTVDCSTQGAVTVFGPAVSNACVTIQPNTGGKVAIQKVPLNNESTVPATSPFSAAMIALSTMLLGGVAVVLSRRRATS
jgi:hypothetical protein